MADVQLDVSVANRFISSLCKSLQALCHGCVDFNSGIEIVGYININVDKGSKVDCVLNEQVLKSRTNSVTFVSNSFLAKKDLPTTDRACSPMPQPSSSYSAIPESRPTHQTSNTSNRPKNTKLVDHERIESAIETMLSAVRSESQKRPHLGVDEDGIQSRKKLRNASSAPSNSQTSQSQMHLEQSFTQQDSLHPVKQEPREAVLTGDRASNPAFDISSSNLSALNVKSETNPDTFHNKSSSSAAIQPSDSENIESLTLSTSSHSSDLPSNLPEPDSFIHHDDPTKKTNSTSTQESQDGTRDTFSSEPYAQASSSGVFSAGDTGNQTSHSVSAFNDAVEGPSGLGQFDVIEIEDDEMGQELFDSPSVSSNEDLDMFCDDSVSSDPDNRPGALTQPIDYKGKASTSSGQVKRGTPKDLLGRPSLNTPTVTDTSSADLVTKANTHKTYQIRPCKVLLCKQEAEGSKHYPAVQTLHRCRKVARHEESSEEALTHGVDLQPKEHTRSLPFFGPLKLGRLHEKDNARTRKIFGLEYTTLNGERIRAKSVQAGCSLKCKHMCHQKFGEKERWSIFEYFWNLGDRPAQRKFIASNASIVPIKPGTNSRFKRRMSHCFFHSQDGKNLKLRVCRLFFADTLDVTLNQINRAVAEFDDVIQAKDTAGLKFVSF